jgi:hypothetical protein
MTTTTTLKDLLNQLFKSLRQKGYLARQSYLCCTGCAFSAATQALEEKGWKLRGAACTGVVFYTRQDAGDIDAKDAGVYLAHSPAVMNAGEEARRQIGRHVVALAKDVGLQVEWDDDPSSRIWVELPKPQPTFIGAGI